MKAEGNKNIRDYISFYRDADLEEYDLDDKLTSVLQDIIKLDIPEYDGTTVPYISRKEMVSRSRAFYKSKLLFHDVSFIPDRKIKRIGRKMVSSIDELIEMCNNTAALVSPYRIPVRYLYDNSIAGTLDANVIVPKNIERMDREELRQLVSKIKMHYSKIILPKKTTELSVSNYVHELMHTQLESNPKTIDNYYDSEVLTIFMELLCAYEQKSDFHMLLTHRIGHMCYNHNVMFLYLTEQYDKLGDEHFSKYDYCRCAKYLISELKAFNLLDIYLNGSYATKKEILISVQSVIDGVRNMSSFLEKMDISYENSLDSDITKRLLSK